MEKIKSKEVVRQESILRHNSGEEFLRMVIDVDMIDSHMAPTLKSEMVWYVNQDDAMPVLLDMSKVKYIDSQGLSFILVTNRLHKDKERALFFLFSEELLEERSMLDSSLCLGILPFVTDLDEFKIVNIL